MTAELGRREQNKNANRDAILRAALSVFVEQGYESVTVRDVIRRTNLACGTFYNYFPDKESLFRALLEARMEPFAQRVRQARADAVTPEEFLYRGYAAAFHEARDEPEWFALLFRNEPAVRAMFSEPVISLMLGTLHEDLGAAIERGLLPRLDLDYLCAAVFGLGYEMLRVLVQQPHRNADEAARFASRMVLTGLCCELGSVACESPATLPATH